MQQITPQIFPDGKFPKILKVAIYQKWDVSFLYLLELVKQNNLPLIEASRLLESKAYRIAIQQHPFVDQVVEVERLRIN